MKQLEGRKIACFTLGCKLNYAETSAIVERLQASVWSTPAA